MDETYNAEIEQDIFDTPADNEQAKVEAKKLLLPDGWYTTELPTTFTPKKYDDDRRVANYFTTIVNNKDTEIRGKIGFQFSPDLRPDQKNPDLADWNYRMFLQARKAFIEATGTEPEKDTDVVRYVAEYPIQVRLVQTKDDKNMVVSLRAVKEM